MPLRIALPGVLAQRGIGHVFVDQGSILQDAAADDTIPPSPVLGVLAKMYMPSIDRDVDHAAVARSARVGQVDAFERRLVGRAAAAELRYVAGELQPRTERVLGISRVSHAPRIGPANHHSAVQLQVIVKEVLARRKVHHAAFLTQFLLGCLEAPLEVAPGMAVISTTLVQAISSVHFRSYFLSGLSVGTAATASESHGSPAKV